MNGWRSVRRSTMLVLAAVTSVLVTVISPAAAGVPGSAAVRCSTRPVQPSIPGADSQLDGVAVLTGCDAWAVGFSSARAGGPPWPLVLHWNGQAWQPATLPGLHKIAVMAELSAVTFVSASRAWAVGWYRDPGGTSHCLIIRWNGRSWRQVPSPFPQAKMGGNALQSVVAASPDSAWAAGWYTDQARVAAALLMHWNGRRWAEVSVPDGGGGVSTSLATVAVAPHGAIWVVENTDGNINGGEMDEVLRYADGSWGDDIILPALDNLWSVASASPSRAWAVGSQASGYSSVVVPLILEWNGSAWQQQAVPGLPKGAQVNLDDLTVKSGTSAWAVGSYQLGRVARTLVLHWNGTSWRQVTSANPGGQRSGDGSGMIAVAGQSCATIWAVGTYTTPKIASHGATFRC